MGLEKNVGRHWTVQVTVLGGLRLAAGDEVVAAFRIEQWGARA